VPSSLEGTVKYLPPTLSLGKDLVLVHFWKTIIVFYYAGGLKILADGNRMAVKEERVLADGILTLSVFFFLEGKRRAIVARQCSNAANFQSIYSHTFSKVSTLLSLINLL
jgi:hypothetical protein